MVDFSRRTFKILKYGEQRWDLPQSVKQDLFRHILKSSAGMGSQFFRTITGI